MSDECAYCGRSIPTEEWHPVATERGDDGVEIYGFCSEACRTDWQAETATDD